MVTSSAIVPFNDPGFTGGEFSNGALKCVRIGFYPAGLPMVGVQMVYVDVEVGAQFSGEGGFAGSGRTEN